MMQMIMAGSAFSGCGLVRQTRCEDGAGEADGANARLSLVPTEDEPTTRQDDDHEDKGEM